MGLVNIVQHGRQRFFLPQESPWLALKRVLSLYPPESTSISFLPELNIGSEELTKKEPVTLPEWLIEPDLESTGWLSGLSEKSPRGQNGDHPVNELFEP
jgi:hypothetical protein